MSVYGVSECGYCGFFISGREKWVREKTYDSTYKNGGEAKYRRYHSEVFTGDELSCWEKHLMQLEFARTTPRAA